MKVSHVHSAAVWLHIGVGLAVPQNPHETLHQPKRQATTFGTTVWVNTEGQPISTEIRPLESAPWSAVKPNASPGDEYASACPFIPAFEPTVPNKPTSFPSSTFVNDPFPTSTTSPSISSSMSAITSTPLTPASPSSAQEEIGRPGGGENAGNSMSTVPTGMGICYDMMSTGCKQPPEIQSDFAFLRAQGYSVVRIYDIGCDVSNYVTAANTNSLQLMIGLNNPGANAGLASQLDTLIGMVGGVWDIINTVYLGNELVNSGIANSATVQGYVNAGRTQLRAAGYTGPVITVDTFNAVENDPTICAGSDYCGIDAHAFFDPNTPAPNAGAFVLNAYNAVKAKVNMNVVVTESGWPWQGSCNGQACPSPANQATAIDSIMTAFANMPASIFIFEAYDTPYKAAGAFDSEQNWGIYDSSHFANNIGPNKST